MTDKVVDKWAEGINEEYLHDILASYRIAFLNDGSRPALAFKHVASRVLNEHDTLTALVVELTNELEAVIVDMEMGGSGKQTQEQRDLIARARKITGDKETPMITILGIDPAATTGMAIRYTDESGSRHVRPPRAAEYKITRPKSVEDALIDFVDIDILDLVVIEGMFVGINPHAAIRLVEIASWFEAYVVHYFPGVTVLRPKPVAWRKAVNISGGTELCKARALLLAREHGLSIKDHNAAEAYCMTYYSKA